VSLAGYWPSPWPGEDGGPDRIQRSPSPGPGFTPENASVVFRDGVATTMVVLRGPGEVFVLRHTAGPDAVSWVERVDPVTLEVQARSVDLAGGPTWPGGLAAHADGSLYVVFGNHAHRLDASLEVLVSVELPRHAPYNSFVVLPDGHLVTKDFGGVLPGQDPDAHEPPPSELLVLAPGTLEVVARCSIPEPSIARLSADGSTVYVVGTTTLYRADWDGTVLVVDPDFAATYVILPGQTYGWDATMALGAAWFLDNGFGSERYIGTFKGQGVNTTPLHLVRVDLASGEVMTTEICGLPGGVVANPPLVDEERRIVVGFDSGNGVLAAFDVADDGTVSDRWTREQDHGCHMVLFGDTGELVTADHHADTMSEDLVVLDIETGGERLRIASGSAVQSVLFPAVGWDRDIYYCSFAGLARLAVR
jgi:hypothetical protein